MAKRSSILHWKGSRLRVLSVFFIGLMILSGCGGNAMSRLTHVDENSASLQIIINDDEIKDREDSSMLVDALKEALLHSFKDVSVKRGYNSAKVGELVIIPQRLKSSAYMRDNWNVIANVDSTIKVLTFTNYKVYSLDGADVYKPSVGEKLVLVVPFVGHATEAALKGPYVTAAKNKAMESMVAKFHDRLVSSPEFKAYVESLKMAKIPADLEIRVRFTDADSFLPNNTLDAGEDAELVVTVSNKGKGPGYGTNLEVVTDNSKVFFEKNITIGDIPPGETRDIKINLKSARNIGDEKVSFKLNLNEKRGYNAKSVVLNVSISNQINRIIDSIISKTIYKMRQKGWKRIAIAEIDYSDSSYIKLNNYLLEEFYSKFGQIKEISVVEKNLIDKALIRVGPSFSNLIRPSSGTNFFINHETVKKFGELTEGNTIFYWIIAESSGKRKIKTYLVDIDKGKIF
ncbi:MAG: hypothetical protein M1610_07235 [Nitrospirae bacterium]|nr:hypothetical protein [Nitrospirota bacterium]MDA8338202.1 hypothetical protein [Nitrospiraceae bacterium]